MRLVLNKDSPPQCKRPQKQAFQKSLTQAIDKHMGSGDNVRIVLIFLTGCASGFKLILLNSKYM